MSITPSSFIQSFKISDVLSNADQNTLVIFDINQTLTLTQLNPNEEVCVTPELLSENDKRPFLKMIVSKNVQDCLPIARSMNIADEKAWAFLEKYFTAKATRKIISGEYWENARPHITTSPVEQETVQTICKLQERNIPTMAFTAKGREAVDFVTQSLQSIGISFSQGSFSNVTDSKKPTEDEKGFFFQNGILFTLREKPAPLEKIDGKGEPLIAFLNTLTPKPKKVLFVDNREELVDDVIKKCCQEQISVIGMWYRRCERLQRLPLSSTYSCPEDWKKLDYTTDQVRAYLTKRQSEPPGSPSSQDLFYSQDSQPL